MQPPSWLTTDLDSRPSSCGCRLLPRAKRPGGWWPVVINPRETRMPLRPIDKSADERSDRNEVEEDRQQILDQVALGRWPAFPPATHRLLSDCRVARPDVRGHRALPAAGNHRGGRQRRCAGPPRHAQRQRLSPTARRRSDKPGAADGHGSRIGEPSNNRAVGNTRNAYSGAGRDLRTQRVSPDAVAGRMGPVNAGALPSTPRWPLADVGDAVGRLSVRVTKSIRRRQLRNRNTSSRGRRGVAGASFVVGAIPTRISTWDTASCPITAATSSRVVRSSVMWVTVQVPKPVIVHSSRTADSTSPHINASFRESPYVDSARIFEWSLGTSARRSR